MTDDLAAIQCVEWATNGPLPVWRFFHLPLGPLQDIFERRRKYGMPVWMSRHPDLNNYIFQVSCRSVSCKAGKPV